MSLTKLLKGIVSMIKTPAQEKIVFTNVFKQIQDDVDTIDEYLDTYQDVPVTKEQLENDDLVVEYAEIFRRYKADYCPYSDFEFFNKTEKIEYMYKRMEIERLLKLPATEFKL